MNIVLFGAPGSGKGTQSEFIVGRLGFKHISTGDLLRSAIQAGTPLGLSAKKFMDAGHLVPDEVVIGLVDSLVAGATNASLIFDGFPRTVAQADALAETLLNRGQGIGKAVFLQVPEDKLLRRLTGRRVAQGSGAVYHIDFKPPLVEGKCDVDGSALIQRADDTESVVGQRLKEYERNTQPLKDYYKKLGLYAEVNGDQVAEAVFEDIKKVLN